MARIRTIDFLPEIFQTPTNKEFLAATLDQVVNPPSTSKIQGYIGSKLGYGINAKDYYVPEPTKTRTDYQLEPGVVFQKTNESTAKDFISYPGILDAISIQHGITDDNNRLFNSQFYSWDSFCDFDKLVNYNQYYWLPEGPPVVNISSAYVYYSTDYVVTALPNGYSIRAQESSQGSTNPTITLLRGGTYNFFVNQDTQFWIQGEPGVNGYSLTQPNLPVRDVYGVDNNGASTGVVTFNVPASDAQGEYDFAINNSVDVVATVPFSQINGQLLSTVQNIDGVTGLEGLRVVFYNTGVIDEQGYINSGFGEVQYDTNDPAFIAEVPNLTITLTSCDTSSFTLASGNTDGLVVGQTITFNSPSFGGVTVGQVYYIVSKTSSTIQISTTLGGTPLTLTAGSGSMIANVNQGLLEDGFYTSVNSTYYRIQYLSTGNSDPVLRLVPDGTINELEKITPRLGTVYANRPLYRDTNGYINLIPYLTAPLTTLYYQDGTYPDRVGIIKIIDNNLTNTLNVTTDILGHKQFTSSNGVQFTNGLKVSFSGDVIPTSYLEGEYYVEGVGTAIELIPVGDLVCPEKFTQGIYNPFDTTPWDVGDYEINLYLPVLQDYITIARNSYSRNAWSRSNRWFHIDVINKSAEYNSNPTLVNIANGDNKAKRPIIEFYPNLQLFDTGIVGKSPIDFFDMTNTSALSTVPDSVVYYPDIQVYSTQDASIIGVSSTPISVSALSVGGTYKISVLGDTDWNVIAGTVDQTYSVGDRVLCVNVGTGTGIAIPVSTTVVVPVNAVYGNIQDTMYISDALGILPNNSQITQLTNDGTNYFLNVTWLTPQTIPYTRNVSIVASAISTDNYSLFPGARVVFSNDSDVNVRNKIYVAEYSTVTNGSDQVITLTLAEDGVIDPNTQVIVYRGYNNQGKSFYFDGNVWKESQQKTQVNQAPLFDIFDKNGISLSDNDIYVGTSFNGTKLFSYKVGTGTSDTVLGFPISYSSVNNIGDISFDVNINEDIFTYVQNGNPITENINIGYVYNYTTPSTYTRKLGWETAVAPSVQYQVFNFNYDITNPVTYLECDIAALPNLAVGEKGWPRVRVFYNNVYQSGGHSTDDTNNVDFTYTIGTDTTTIQLINKPTESTPIQVLVLSDQVSSTAYYQVPINLTNNPLNGDLTTVNLGDIRNHYEKIFGNAPDTVGPIFGNNNYRDCGNLLGYGTQIIQNSASLVLPGAFLRSPYHNLFDSLIYNSREYITYKQQIVSTVNSIGFDQTYTPSTVLDTALAQIAASKSEINSFFWSDMLPNGSPYISNTYTFNNGLDRSIFPLSTVYNFSSANYQGVIVYLFRNGYEYQLLKDVDYTISTDSPSLTIETDLLNGDVIRINEFNQTYGSYVPYTPTKLGLYPLFEPGVVLESDYLVPTYFIKGHDGSYTKLYGDYDEVNNVLIDFRDQALLEFEQRIYNNIKLSTNVPIRDYEVLPGYFRQGTATYTYDEFIEMYTPNFLDWVGQNRLDYKTQYFNKNNEYTYNYRNSGNKLDNSAIEQGYWRGTYNYFYDTFAPNLTPWQMLGFSEMPTWWTSRYGPAPYTSSNLILWNDIENGYIYNNGDGYFVPELARPGLSQIIPVDSAGNLVSPFSAIVGNYTATTFQSEWKVGDVGPVELSYRRSSTWPFDLIKLFALTRPAEFFNYAVDLDNYKYNSEFNQYLVNDRSHLVVSDIAIYGDGTAKTSFINWIVDYEKQQGIDSTTNITDMLNNIDVRLVYRMAGYSSKELMNFYVEKSSANSNNSTLLIPQESYSILLYENQPYDKIVFSSVIVQQNKGYWTVYGNSQNFAYFEILDPLYDGKTNTLSVENSKVKVAVNYTDNKTLVPYGTKFYNTQDLSQFLMSYGANLTSKGVVFDSVVNGLTITWDQMVLEFLYWSQQGWENGSIITLNPSAQDLVIDAADTIVQPLTLQQSNFILNQNLYPIKLQDICVNRDGTRFHAHTINVGDSMSYAQFNMSNFEHGVVFDNLTLFNDVIYSPVTGLKQDRIFTRGLKTAEWNGTVNAWGFILSQDNIQEYSGSVKYTKNAIVMYKNEYYTSLTIIEPSNTFDETKWKKISYSDIQFGLLPNPSTRAYESVLYYDIYKANLQQEADLLSFSLIGFRPRDYLQSIDLTDSAQIQVYQNLIKNKGTLNAVSAFSGANLPQGGIQYETYENWAIQNSNYGGVLNQNFVEFKINQANMTGDPAIVSLTDGVDVPGSMQAVPIWQLYNYENTITQANILQTTSTSTNNLLFPSAGYVNYSDVKMASYFYSQLPFAVNSYNNSVPIQNFYVGDYVWLANFKEQWNVFRWKTIGQIVQVRGNTNQTATVTFNTAHGLSKNDPMAIVNFAAGVDGYYLVTDVVNLNEVIINLNLVTSNNNSIQGRGLGFAFESQRVAQPSDIANLNLIENEFIKNTVWVDTNSDGDWAVYQKTVNYTPFEQKTNNLYGTFGSAVAYTPLGEYWYSDAENGIVYRNTLDNYSQTINTIQTISGSSSFGTSIAYTNNVVAVSQPTTGYNVNLYVVNNTSLTDQAQLIQTISRRDTSINWGNNIAFSDDGNWLYISALDKGTVYVYQKQNIPTTAGYLIPGETYVIDSLGSDQATVNYINQYGNNTDYIYPAGVIYTSSGDIVNISYDFYNGGVYLVKYSSLGEIIYQKYYADPKYAEDLVVDESNNLYTTFSVQGAHEQSVLTKISSADGSILWQKVISDATYDVTPGSVAYRGGYVYQTLNRGLSSGNAYTIVIKYLASTGQIVWQRKLNTPSATSQISRTIDTDTSSNVYVAVYDQTNGIGYVVKYNSSGTVLWQRKVTGLTGTYNNFVTYSNSTLLMTCHYNNAAVIMKLDPSTGATIWQRYIGDYAGTSSTAEFVYSATTDTSGNVYFAGEGNYDPLSGYGDILVAKFSSSGALVFQRTLNTSDSIYEDVYYERKTNITVKNGLMLFTGFVETTSNSQPIVAQLPSDGSLTGTQGVWMYYPSSFDTGTSTLTNVAGDLTNTTETYATTNGSIGPSVPAILDNLDTDFITTDFTTVGAVENKVGITFVATGTGSGTGTATQVTYKYANSIAGTSADLFGSTIATNNDGSVLVVGAPYYGTQNDGAAYAYARTVQNYLVPNNTVQQNASFTLAWTPNNLSSKTGSTVTTSNITLNNVTSLLVNMPIIFVGTNNNYNDFKNTGIVPYTVYYIHSIVGSTIKIKSSRNSTTAITLTDATGLAFSVYPQNNTMFVSVNGNTVTDNNYAVVGNTFYYLGTVLVGDIINVSDSQFNLIQQFNSSFTSRIDAQFGTSVDITKLGSDIVVGSPYEINDNNVEGAVYSYINGGAKYGYVIGTSSCNVTTTRTVLINGFAVVLYPGNAASVAQQINDAKLINVQAAATSDNKLMIQLINNELSPVEQKLIITAFSSNVLSELGLQVYTNTQIITSPHGEGPTQFGTTVKLNDSNGLLVSSPVGTRYEGTFFDFTDDTNLDNDTLFDNNATGFVEQYPNAGAVYMFEYLSNYKESLNNPGKYVYAQDVIDNSLDYGYNPGYGLSLEFSDNTVMVGCPNYQPATVGGKVVIYNNASGQNDWIVYRQSSPVVDIEKIQNTQLFSATTNQTLVNFDYPDPLQNKLLGAARENIDFISSADPAKYNVNYTNLPGMIWGAEQVGKIWFDTTNVRWMNYHQNDVVYNSRHWAMVFPGSDVAVYTWISSYILPVNYQGPGTPYDVNQYVIGSSINSSGLIVPVYYFWVRNTNIIFEQANKTLSDTVVASYIINPIGSGVSFMAPLLPNAFAMYNSGEYFNGNDTVFHIGYSTGTAVDVAHTEYSLIRENNEEDFLPGFPDEINPEPHALYAKMLDSLSGCDISGQVVPNPLLPKLVQQGILNVPRQSFFYDRTLALNNYLSYANNILIQYPIVELRENLSFLFTSGDYYNTMDYWEYANWWATGYNNGTKTTIQVPYYADLSALSVPVNTLVKVEKNGAGKFEVYRYDGNSQWTRIGLENGTIQFKSTLWDYSAGKIGYSGNFFDTDSFDSYPSQETRNIVRALNEQIFVQELLIYRNKALILLFEYIQAETLESQNYLTWLNKTSLVNVSHTIRELLPYEVYKTDDQAFLSSYINEVKPYHVVIKDFSFKYTKTDVYEGDITDFDLPARYNSQYEQFISPQMVYTEYTDNEYQYNYNDTIWNTTEYLQWYSNYGLSLGNAVYDTSGNITGYVGEPDYPITTLSSYVTFATKYLVVKNASGFPINGVIKIDDELIGYNNVDKATNVLSGLVRGVNNTPVQDHYPSTDIYIDLPAVVLLSGGRGYSNPPKVTAKIDTTIYPAPTVPAVLEAVMSLDSVLQINVINPGKGYAVLPEIVIEPGIVVTFDNTMVVSKLNNIRVYAPDLRTGDLVQYKNNGGAGVGRLVDNEWYYINVLETTPDTIIGLYSTYSDAINDEHRIKITDIGPSTGMTLNVGARAIAITQSSPVRENNIGLRFDRTSYQSKIIDWEAGSFYGAYYAGSYYNTDKLASTNITLESTSPNINDLLASAHGVVFEVQDVNIEETYDWSSFVRVVARTFTATSAIRLAPQDGNPSNLSQLEPNASGSTIGLYKNMPIKFAGTTVGGIVAGQLYFVRDVLSETDFTISSTVNGPIVPISSAIAPVGGMTCITAQVSQLPVLTVNYPGILNTVGTTAGINTITIPVSEIGTGGTIGFTPGTLLYFTATSPNEEIFGGLIENQVYYVNTVIDDQTFTVSRIDVNVATNIDDKPFTNTTDTPVYSTSVSATSSTGNVITVSSTSDFALGDPVIFNQMIIGGTSVTNFGNIVSGQLYYVSEIVSNTQLKITDVVNGATFALGNASGSMVVTNQKNVVQLTTATGLMTANVALPVSPGQVNGQKFEMYTTSQQYPNITAPNITVGTLLSATTYASITTVNRLAVDNTDWFYTGMPVQLQTTIGGLSASTTYYIKDYTGGPDTLNPGQTLGPISVICDSTSSTGNKIHVTTDTSSLFVNMPITFTGVGLGNIVVDQLYYVKSISDSTHFTISETIGGTTFVLQNDSGGMTGTGVPYITLSATPGGSVISLSSEVPVIPVTLNQIILTNPTFDISYILGGYRVVVQNGGSGFAITNTISISGSLVGGSSPANDLVLEVNTIDGTGAITSAIISGTPNSVNRDYYFKIRGSNQFEVYVDSLMTIPADGSTFPYTGFTSTTATAVTASNDYITVNSTSAFSQYDPVVFTGTMFSSDIVLGQTYYIKNIVSGTQLTISATPNGTTLNISADSTGSMTMAKAGSFAFLSEPFYFNPSIIRFNNRLYNCLVSNNDLEFVIGKWQLIDSGNRRINALDRVVGYYQPTVNMPGKDLTQLFEGITYPNSTYKGNAFEPALQFDLDTILQDQIFYPTNVNLTGIVYNNGYFASANLPDYSSIVYSPDGVNWINAKLASSNVNLTDIIYANGLFIITSQNPTTPLYLSTNGSDWTTTGTYTPWGSAGWDAYNYDSTALSIANISLQSATYFNGAWIAVGSNIVRSTDGYGWNEVLVLPVGRNYQLYSIASVQTAQFTGVVAVGKGTDESLNPISVIYYSTDGIIWNVADITSDQELYSVSADSTKMIAAGQNGVLFESFDANTWYGVNQGYVTGVSSDSNILSTTNMALQLNQRVRFSNSFSNVVAGTYYYVKSIISPSLITISLTSGGATLDLIAGTVPPNTIMYSYDGYDINDITYASSTWVAVGESGKIKTSTDGLNYTTRTSNTTANLTNVAYISSNQSFVVVGDNNTILTSYNKGATWANTSIFETVPAAHTVKGADFQYGYGPEELVAGVVRDNLALTVNTRPGGSWPSVTYANNGYTVISNEVVPTNDQQTVYFFGDYAEYPAQVFVQKLSASTGLGTTLTQGTDYTVNWLNKTITLATPLTLVPLQTLRIDVYEVGNGEQLVKSNTDVNPIRTNDATGFNEIYLDCNFTGEPYQGSGIIMPGTYEYSVAATATQSITNRITVDSVADLTLGAPITFSGTLFGGVASNTTYFIKYISYATNTITISLTYDPDTGVAGPEVTLTTDSGSMNLNLSAGSQVSWTSPIIYNNGSKLVQGYSSQITSTASGTNYITTDSTAGMVPGCKIIFSNSAFGGITPLTTYYVKQVVGSFIFTISATPGGSEVVLTDSNGAATYITYDYAFGIQPNGVAATLVLAGSTYTNQNNYIVYAMFGQTTPQIGYTIPETQTFVANGSTKTYNLTNNVDDVNAANAIVERNGLRLTSSQYSINASTDVLTITSTPSAGDIISITTFNDASEQYLNTQFNVSGTVTSIINVNNNVAPITTQALATASIASTDLTNPNQIVCDSTANFVVGQRVVFKGTSFGGISTSGTVYYINSVVDSTHFTIKDYLGNIVNLTTGSGSMIVRVGGQPAVIVTTSAATTFTTNTLVRIDGLVGSTQLNNGTYYVRVVTPTTFELYSQPYTSSASGVNYPITDVSSYVSGGYIWVQGQYRLIDATASRTYAVSPTYNSSTIVVTDTSKLISGTPIYFSKSGYQNGAALTGGLVQGTVYYVKNIYSGTEFSVSTTQFGDEMTLTSGVLSFDAKQWNQTNVDRLWVTVNGTRVPSSKLRLNDFNEVSILTSISSGNTVIITSMTPSATPNQEIYMNLVDDMGVPTVYRAPADSRTWLTENLYPLSTTVSVDDLNSVVNTIVQTVITPALVNGVYTIGLNVDKRSLISATVYNNTKQTVVPSEYVTIMLSSIAPAIDITDGSYIDAGDSLTVTSIEGNTIYVNGEQISFTGVDFANSQLTGISRGVNGTGQQPLILKNTTVYSLMHQNRLSDTYYNQTWNSNVYNTVSGDPLQISTTVPALFLNVDNS